ncbi:hypothetical protein HanIR_Chr13g0648481 [Helianthus annuus]|nr:hypothetical protein HanIR_Chr13g0648481 [Helianthus annuus]
MIYLYFFYRIIYVVQYIFTSIMFACKSSSSINPTNSKGNASSINPTNSKGKARGW